MKNSRNRLTYILTSVGEEKIVNTLAKEYINPRNRIKWIQMQLNYNRLKISRDTIHKILTKQRVEEYAIKSVFEALKLSYESNIDSVPASKETSVTDSCPQDFFPVENKGANFFGRDDDLKKLNTLFNQHQKIIVIQAPGGTGKTTLAKQYLDNHGFDLVLSLEMAGETENITSIESIVDEWLKQYFQEEPGREFGITLIRLKKHLQNRRVGILIDNLEPAIDKHGKFIQNHSRYLELFKVLADATVQSFTIITSRECLFDDRIDVIYHYYLSRLSGSAWQEFFAFHEVEIDVSLLEEMHIKYGGNAKAMHILIGSIKTDYEGDATAYWQENCTLVERGLKNLVVNQFERLQSLNPDAYKLLCRLGCYRYQDIPQVTEDALLALLWDIPDHQRCIYIIKALRNLRLVEFVNGKYWLHSVIKEESIKRLKSSQEWEGVNRKAAEFWRGSVKNIRTSEDTKKAFEVYYHYECIHDLKKAGYLLIERRNSSYTPDKTLAVSYYQTVGFTQIIFMLNSIRKNVKSPYILLITYITEGSINQILGNINIAINFYNKSLALVNSLLEGFENNKMDTKYDEVDFCVWRKAYILYKLCLIYKDLGDVEKSFKMYHEAINLCQKQAQFMGDIFTIPQSFQAVKYNPQYSLFVAHILTGLAELGRTQNNFKEALSNHSKSIEVFNKTNANRYHLAAAYFQLGLTYQKMGEFQNSQINFEQAIILFTEAGVTQQIEKVQKAIQKTIKPPSGGLVCQQSAS